MLLILECIQHVKQTRLTFITLFCYLQVTYFLMSLLEVKQCSYSAAFE